MQLYDVVMPAVSVLGGKYAGQTATEQRQYDRSMDADNEQYRQQVFGLQQQDFDWRKTLQAQQDARDIIPDNLVKQWNLPPHPNGTPWRYSELENYLRGQGMVQEAELFNILKNKPAGGSAPAPGTAPAQGLSQPFMTPATGGGLQPLPGLFDAGNFPTSPTNIDPGFSKTLPGSQNDIDPGFSRSMPGAENIDPGFTFPWPGMEKPVAFYPQAKPAPAFGPPSPTATPAPTASAAPTTPANAIPTPTPTGSTSALGGQPAMPATEGDNWAAWIGGSGGTAPVADTTAPASTPFDEQITSLRSRMAETEALLQRIMPYTATSQKAVAMAQLLGGQLREDVANITNLLNYQNQAALKQQAGEPTDHLGRFWNPETQQFDLRRVTDIYGVPIQKTPKEWAQWDKDQAELNKSYTPLGQATIGQKESQTANAYSLIDYRRDVLTPEGLKRISLMGAQELLTVLRQKGQLSQNDILAFKANHQQAVFKAEQALKWADVELKKAQTTKAGQVNSTVNTTQLSTLRLQLNSAKAALAPYQKQIDKLVVDLGYPMNHPSVLPLVNDPGYIAARDALDRVTKQIQGLQPGSGTLGGTGGAVDTAALEQTIRSSQGFASADWYGSIKPYLLSKGVTDDATLAAIRKRLGK